MRILAFREGGTVTAGNSSGINDAAAFLVLAAADVAQRALRLLRLQTAWLVAQLLLALVVILATPWLSLAG